MTPDEFRIHGHDLIDLIADYVGSVEQGPVGSTVAPGDVRSQLPEHPPTHIESFVAVMADVEQVVVPGLTQWQHPGFFAYFPSNTSFPSILGELLSAGLGVQGMSWITSPACTEVETLLLDWMQELLGLPATFRSTSATGGGVIQGTASEATLVATCRPDGAPPAAPSTTMVTPLGWSPLRHRKLIRASRRASGSPGSVPTGSASLPTTTRSPCAPTRSTR